MNFLPQELVDEIRGIRSKSLAVFGYSQYKDLPLHKYSGAISFHIPDTPYKTNYLPFYIKDICERIFYSKIAIIQEFPELLEELIDEILVKVLQDRNSEIGWYHYK